MSRYVQNPTVEINPRAPQDVQRALYAFNHQPVTTPDELAAAEELAALYAGVPTAPGPKGATPMRNCEEYEDRKIIIRRTPASESDSAAHEAAAAHGRAAAAVELGRQLAEHHMTPAQRQRAAALRARRDAETLE